jgi:hypothetical protein
MSSEQKRVEAILLFFFQINRQEKNNRGENEVGFAGPLKRACEFRRNFVA